MTRINLDSLRLPDKLDAVFRESSTEKPTITPVKRIDGWFLQGPIPGKWLERAAILPGRALHVALAVWHAHKIEKSVSIKLTGKWQSLFGVKPDAGRRGLDALERAGLVSVQRHAGRCPIVMILDA